MNHRADTSFIRRVICSSLLVGAFAWCGASQAQRAAEQLGKDKQVVSGTATRTEHEFKLAFWLDTSFPIHRLIDAVKERIDVLIAEQAFQFPQLMQERYVVSKQFQSFLFQDWYLDTPRKDVLTSQSAYRLRYRWATPTRYDWFQWLPILPWFHPHRCEIQFKRDYQVDDAEGSVTVQETRFEFRNESPPFDIKDDAPLPPWPVKEFVDYAQIGRYRAFKINAHDEMLKTLKRRHGLKRRFVLKPLMKVNTVRNRVHLNMKHPWGSGPNLDQVFIVTIDESNAWIVDEKLKSVRAMTGKRYVEIEVEIDRNASTWLRNVAEVDPRKISVSGDVAEQGIKFTRRAWGAVKADGWELKIAMRDVIEDVLHEEPLPTDFKYRRLATALLQEGRERQEP